MSSSVAVPEQPRPYAVALTDQRGRWFSIGAILTALLSLPTQVLFERGLGVNGFAQWLLINSYVTFFVPLACLGATNLLLSEFFQGRLGTAEGRREVVRYFAITTTVAVVGFIAVYGFAPLSIARTRIDVTLGALLILAQVPVVLGYSLFQIHHEWRLVAFWPTLQNLGRFAVAALTLAIAMSSTAAVAGWLGTTVLLAFWVMLYPGILTLPVVAAAEERPTGPLIARAMRFGIAEYLDSMDLKLAIPVVAVFLPAKPVAAVGLGLLFSNAAHFFPYALVTRYLLPAVHSNVGEDTAAMRATITQWILTGSALIVAGALGFALLGDRVVALLAKGDYHEYHSMFVTVGLTMIPLCLSILASAPFMRVEFAKALMAWRIHATIGFLVVTVAAIPFVGAAAPFVGIFANRLYLLVRFARAWRTSTTPA